MINCVKVYLCFTRYWLYGFVCMCVCSYGYVCICVRLWIYMDFCTCPFACICVLVCVCLCVHIDELACVVVELSYNIIRVVDKLANKSELVHTILAILTIPVI